MGDISEATPECPVPMVAAIVGQHDITNDQLLARGREPDEHDLEADKTTQPTGKFIEHLLARDPVAATPGSEPSHPIGKDPTTTQDPGSSRHDMARDQVAQTGLRSRPHALKDDDSFVLMPPRSKHILQSDPAVTTPGHETPHTLDRDAVKVSVGSLVLPHRLGDDARVSQGSESSAHPIEADKAVPARHHSKPHRLGD